jgi:hypothetical protein
MLQLGENRARNKVNVPKESEQVMGGSEMPIQLLLNLPGYNEWCWKNSKSF